MKKKHQKYLVVLNTIAYLCSMKNVTNIVSVFAGISVPTPCGGLVDLAYVASVMASRDEDGTEYSINIAWFAPDVGETAMLSLPDIWQTASNHVDRGDIWHKLTDAAAVALENGSDPFAEKIIQQLSKPQHD